MSGFVAPQDRGARLSSRRLGSVVGLVLLLSSASALVRPPADVQAATCSSSYGSRFDGLTHTQQPGEASIVGASTLLVVREDNHLCTGGASTNFSSAWAMLASADAQGWVQSGYWNYATDPCLDDLFSQYHEPGSSVYPTKFGTYDYGDSCLVDGSTFNFWEQYSGACHCEHANVNSSQFDTTPFDPTVWFSAPLQTQFLGEVKYLQDDMPGTGTQNSAEVFSSLKEQQATTGSFVPLGCGSTAVNDQPSAWGGPFVANCQLFSIWEL